MNELQNEDFQVFHSSTLKAYFLTNVLLTFYELPEVELKETVLPGKVFYSCTMSTILSARALVIFSELLNYAFFFFGSKTLTICSLALLARKVETLGVR